MSERSRSLVGYQPGPPSRRSRIEKARFRSTWTMPEPGQRVHREDREDRRDADRGDEVAVRDLLDRDDRRLDAGAQVDRERVVEQTGEVVVQRAQRLQLVGLKLLQPLVEAEVERLDLAPLERGLIGVRRRELIDERVDLFLGEHGHRLGSSGEGGGFRGSLSVGGLIRVQNDDVDAPVLRAMRVGVVRLPAAGTRRSPAPRSGAARGRRLPRGNGRRR